MTSIHTFYEMGKMEVDAQEEEKIPIKSQFVTNLDWVYRLPNLQIGVEIKIGKWTGRWGIIIVGSYIQ